MRVSKRLLRLAVALSCALLLVGCSAPQPLHLKVMSYNIHHGAGLDKNLDLDRIAGVINAEHPDLVALQEVERGAKRTNGMDQPAELARMTGMQVVFQKNIDFQGGDYGNAVLSRLPIQSHEPHRLPLSRQGEQRGALAARVSLGDKPLVFIATHFDERPDNADRLGAVELLRQLVAKEVNSPVIVAGDLNTTPRSEVIKGLLSFLTDTAQLAVGEPLTFQADRPDRRIDYILYKGQAIRCTGYSVVNEPVASDHRPIVAVFEVKQADR